MNWNMLACAAGWGALMGWVITPHFQLDRIENLCCTLAGVLIITSIFTFIDAKNI